MLPTNWIDFCANIAEPQNPKTPNKWRANELREDEKQKRLSAVDCGVAKVWAHTLAVIEGESLRCFHLTASVSVALWLGRTSWFASELGNPLAFSEEPGESLVVFGFGVLLTLLINSDFATT